MEDTDLVSIALGSILKGSRSAASLEGQRLDFKTDKASERETYQDLAEAAVCFTNASGGVIVVGVADSLLGTSAFVGTMLKIDVLRSRIHALTEPSLVVTVDEIEFGGARLLAVTVPEGLDVHSTRKGLVSRRWNDEWLPMRPIDRAAWTTSAAALIGPLSPAAARLPTWTLMPCSESGHCYATRLTSRDGRSVLPPRPTCSLAFGLCTTTGS